MALILCDVCGRSGFNVDQKCQFCGMPLRFSMWTRKLRRNEAYGFLLLLTGTLLLGLFKTIAVPMLVFGLVLMGLTIVRPRVRPVDLEAPNLHQIFTPNRYRI